MCRECDWKAFVREANDLLDDIEQIPPAGSSFAESVQKKTEGMRDWAEESQHVTEKMEDALANMRGGVERWLGGR